ncbi:MAG: WG repeat-containing protein, partial [Duncaniella sp.]|nr:WG repeat-containing protein [Duncaniella sp.]
NKYGLVDRAGNDVLLPEYDFIDDTSKGMWLIGKEGQYGLLDAEGSELLAPIYSCVTVCDEGGIVITLADRTKKRLDYDGKVIDDFVYDYVTKIGYTTDRSGEDGERITALTGMYAYEVDGYKGLMDGQGHPVTLPLYSEIEALTPVLFDCRIAGTGASILIDAKGKKVND